MGLSTDLNIQHLLSREMSITRCVCHSGWQICFLAQSKFPSACSVGWMCSYAQVRKHMVLQLVIVAGLWQLDFAVWLFGTIKTRTSG